MNSIDRFLRLAKKTNSKFIVHDSATNEDFIILQLDEYEEMLDCSKCCETEEHPLFENNDLEEKFVLPEDVTDTNEEEIEDFLQDLPEEYKEFENNLNPSEELVDKIVDKIDFLDQEVDKVNEDISLWYKDQDQEDKSFLTPEYDNNENKKEQQRPQAKQDSSWHSAGSILEKKLNGSGELEYDEIMEQEDLSGEVESISLKDLELKQVKKRDDSEPVFYEEPI
jgi:hypothetical protein